MNGYIYSIVCVAAAGGIVCIVTPDKGIKKHIKFVCALCLISVLIAPISGFISGIKDFFEGEGEEIFGSIGEEGELRDKYESIYNKYFEGGYGENIGQAVKDSLYEKFGIENDKCRINVVLSDNDGDGVKEPSKITVILNGDAIFKDPTPIKRFISELFKCECKCAIE